LWVSLWITPYLENGVRKLTLGVRNKAAQNEVFAQSIESNALNFIKNQKKRKTFKKALAAVGK